MAPKKSVAWDHFVDKGRGEAECKMCKSIISFKSGVSNLTMHVQRKHLAINLTPRAAEPASTTLTPTTSTPPSQDPQPAQPSRPTLRTGHQPSTIAAFLRRDCHKIKKEIDEHIMSLFIRDMQPFSIVEDRGFRDLMKFAFPNYQIPSRKYFANNLLPAEYEAVKEASKAEVVKDAKSICLTTHLWTSRNNDSYLAITGHYIDDEFVLRSVLLECKVLLKSHSVILMKPYGKIQRRIKKIII